MLRAQADALLASDRLTAPTRAALSARLAWRRSSPRALTARQLAVLDAVAWRLVPLGPLEEVVDLAGRLEADVADGPGDGWRYAAMPVDGIALAAGLDRLEADTFLDGDDAERDRLLEVARTGVADWPVPSDLWFEEVLARLVQLAYAHPLVQLSIGYDGMSDAAGFPAHG
ncbi:hypothetical protein [Sphingomonas bacterium]|uniref:hypothetical protein n=1 Tax=Sphingomonas bacterium TaxID=1895847 RepID=UPI0015769C43|nr:hypothetical protein [Sphingomonas bacterium]